MSGLPSDLEGALDALRRRGAARLDPLRLARIESLAARASQQRDGLRARLDARVLELATACAATLDDTPAPSLRAGRPAAGRATAHDAFVALRERFAPRDEPAHPAVAHTSVALDGLRRASAGARARSQVRQALEQAPQDAGPLNSAQLVHRALVLMRDVSPDYLQAFMGYVDTLAWLDGMAAPDATGPASPSPARRPRAKSARRR